MFNYNESPTLHKYLYPEYRIIPPTPEQYVNSDYYIGADLNKSLFPLWKKDIPLVLGDNVLEWVITGAIGLGKCLVKGTLCHGEYGLIEIDKAKVGDKLDGFDKAKTVIDTHDEGLTDTIKVTTKCGYTLEGRPNHQIKVWDGDLGIIWKPLGSIQTTDIVVLKRGTPLFRQDHKISIQEAELIGAWVGDGHWITRNNISAMVYMSVGKANKSYAKHIISLARTISSYCPKIKEERTALKITVGAKELFQRWLSFDLKTGFYNKKIPNIILEDYELLRYFLRGLFDTDGSVYRSTINMSTSSPVLYKQVQLALLSLGIKSSITTKIPKCNGKLHNRHWIVSITGYEDKVKFKNIIGFSNKQKLKKLDKILGDVKGSYKNDTNILYNSSKFIKESWNNLKGKIPTRKPYSGMFRSSCIGKQNLTVHKLQYLNELSENTVVPMLQYFTKHGYFMDFISSVEKGMNHCYDVSVGGDHSYISHGFVSHNTVAAVIVLSYRLLQLLCLNNAQTHYDLVASHKIVIGNFSLYKYKAERSAFGYMESLLEDSQFFREQGFKSTHTKGGIEIWFERQNIGFVSGSNAKQAISDNTFSFLIDEAAFMNVDKKDADKGQAQALYNELHSRLFSRFHSSKKGSTRAIPGTMIIASSAQDADDFVQSKIRKKEEQDDTTIMVSSYPLWEMKSHLNSYSKDSFYISLGNRVKPAKIIETKKEAELVDDAEVVKVPMDFKKLAEQNLHTFILNTAGKVLPYKSKFFNRFIIQKSHSTRKHPFASNTIHFSFTSDDRFEDYLLVDYLCKVEYSRYVPRLNPHMPRHIHVDIGVTGDALGISMGHIGEFVKVERINTDCTVIEAEAPKIFIDFAIRIVPEDEIQIMKIFSLINYLCKTLNYPIKCITFDRYESRAIKQILQAQGYNSEVLTKSHVDTEAYHTLRNTYSEDRLDMYYHEHYEKEMMHLEVVDKNGKIDHPKKFPDGSKGSKDVSDAVSLTTYCLHNDKLYGVASKDQSQYVVAMKKHTDIYDTDDILDESNPWFIQDYKDKDIFLNLGS